MNHTAKIASAGCLVIAGCGLETNVYEELGEPTSATVELRAEMSPIHVREGDGLPDELPTNLVWETNEDDPAFASTNAKRGGTYRTYIDGFPLTLRRVGPDSNGSFAGYLRPNQFGPVALHPNTRRAIPALATHWAFGEDGRSIYYRLNPNARWSDGVPVTAGDFVFAVQFMRSKEIVAPWYNEYYTERIRDVKRYDDLTYAVQGANAKPGAEMHATYGFGPQPQHFHILLSTNRESEPSERRLLVNGQVGVAGPDAEGAHSGATRRPEYGALTDDWVAEANWKIEPNTGPYQIGEVRKGKYIVMERKADWWGNDLKYFKHRFNPDRIRARVIRDPNVAFQHFLKGELDIFGLVLPQYWHDKATGDEFDKGYIRKYWFYSELPESAGMYLNIADPLLADERVRFGLAHAMNLDRVIATVLRGDYQRLPTVQAGFGDYDNLDITPREFDIDKAGTYFDAAGFDTWGGDGIRVKDGRRLSLNITYGNPPHTERLVVLQEEAKKAGVELKLNLLDGPGSFKKMREKKHQIAWSGWGVGGLAPTYWSFFHSAGANKPQTNNFANFASPEMDALITAYRASATKEERIALARKIEQVVHDAGIVIPTFRVPYTRAGAWRWVKLPDRLATRTSGSLFGPFAESGGFSGGGLFWIDVEEKRRTLDAKQQGRALEPATIINTDHRVRPTG